MDIRMTARKAAGFLAVGLAALALAGTATPAQAQAPWTAEDIGTASDGTTRVLWEANTSGGTVIGVWKMDSKGNKVASGPAYGPYSDSNGNWTPIELMVAPDGTSRLLWFNSGTAGTKEVIWTFDTNGTATNYGTVYGPYSDSNGKWRPGILAFASDNSMRQLWTNTSATAVEAGVWTLDSSGKQTSVGPVYGPFYNASGARWQPRQLSVAPDNSLRLLWFIQGANGPYSGSYTGDTIILWKMDTNGTKTGNGPVYGPYGGWGVANFDINRSDSTLRMLWKNYGTYDDNGDNYTGDIAGVWSFDTNGNETTIGAIYGRYAGWQADGIIALGDGSSRVEWDKTVTDSNGVDEDEVGIWGFDRNDQQSFVGPVYGPYGGWTLSSTGFNLSDNTFRLLWTRNDNTAGVWALNPSGVQTSVGPVYGPYTY